MDSHNIPKWFFAGLLIIISAILILLATGWHITFRDDIRIERNIVSHISWHEKTDDKTQFNIGCEYKIKILGNSEFKGAVLYPNGVLPNVLAVQLPPDIRGTYGKNPSGSFYSGLSGIADSTSLSFFLFSHTKSEIIWRSSTFKSKSFSAKLYEKCL